MSVPTASFIKSCCRKLSERESFWFKCLGLVYNTVSTAGGRVQMVRVEIQTVPTLLDMLTMRVEAALYTKFKALIFLVLKPAPFDLIKKKKKTYSQQYLRVKKFAILG